MYSVHITYYLTLPDISLSASVWLLEDKTFEFRQRTNCVKIFIDFWEIENYCPSLSHNSYFQYCLYIPRNYQSMENFFYERHWVKWRDFVILFLIFPRLAVYPCFATANNKYIFKIKTTVFNHAYMDWWIYLYPS